MTFIRIYLAVYFLLLFGAAFALWQGGVLPHLSGLWVALALLIGVAFGVLLAVVSTPPQRTPSGA
jgi:hypothetical protein